MEENINVFLSPKGHLYISKQTEMEGYTLNNSFKTLLEAESFCRVFAKNAACFQTANDLLNLIK